MTDTAASNPVNCTSWRPPNDALQLERFGDGTDGRRIVLLGSHPTWPFRCTLDVSVESLEDLLQAMAFTYLKKLKGRFDDRKIAFLPRNWMKVLAPGATPDQNFGWHELDKAKAIASRDLTRADDETYILVAGRKLGSSSAGVSDGVGVRVVIRRLHKNPTDFAITSMTAHLPDNQNLDLDLDKVELLKNEGADDSRNASPSAFLQPSYLDATVDVPVFNQVPKLEASVQAEPSYGSLPRPSQDLSDNDLRGKVTIKEDLQTPHFIILNCRNFVEKDADDCPTDAFKIVLPDNHEIDPRSDLQSAISAFYFFNMFFKQTEAFGLQPETLLRRLKLPVQVHYRSGVARCRGKDGNTVNARVSLGKHNEVDIPLNDLPADIAEVHVHLALANLNRWHRDVPADGSFASRPAQPLGIANSRRWVLHELGHVLIAGSLGELEFRFVHSAGDAMAAIICDPESRIAKADRTGPWADYRFQTYPWVYVDRRHDRTVLTGWSWSGTMHWDVLHTPELQLRGLKGYDSEQILSTTLFRLYRILGGDTLREDNKPDVVRRRTASMIVLYLILRATETFVHTPLRAEELESAMIDADICLTTPLTPDGSKIWIGGQAHKAIRWAFEAQGLHPEDPTQNNNGPGAPPPVDLFIKDQRDDLEPTFAGIINHNAGSYVPVSLHWSSDAEWTGGSLSFSNGKLNFGNRGTHKPNSTKTRAWWGEFSGVEVNWLPALLSDEDVTASIGIDLTLAGLGLNSPAFPSNGELLLFLEISDPEDRANTDPETHFDCAIQINDTPPSSTKEIGELVATDNNLGLFWVTP